MYERTFDTPGTSDAVHISLGLPIDPTDRTYEDWVRLWWQTNNIPTLDETTRVSYIKI
jgi:hypothetical protein